MSMSKLFYCPECGQEKISNDNLYKGSETIVNVRDGYGRPIIHYRCECGNYLAGSINVSDCSDDEGAIVYYKEVIKDYNRGGFYYKANKDPGNRNIVDLFEKAKLCYEARKKGKRI